MNSSSLIQLLVFFTAFALTACGGNGNDPALLDSVPGLGSGSGSTSPISPGASGPDRNDPAGKNATEAAAEQYAWVSVSWESASEDAAVNLDLHVVDPNGVEINFINTGGKAGEGRFADHPECISFDCKGSEQQPRESIYWKLSEIVPGEYRAWVANASERSGSFEIEIVARDHRVSESGSVGGGQTSSEFTWTIDGEEADPNAPCLQQLDQLGIDYQTTTINEGGCSVDEAVMVQSPVNGITYKVHYSHSTTRFRTACRTAVALHRLGNVLKSKGLSEVYHDGSFSCRNINGTSTPSQHSKALAMDFMGFGGAGKEYSVVKHWEHGTDNPQSHEAQVLYQIAHEAAGGGIFNLVLTPNYNADHDDHLHMDLGSGNGVRLFTEESSSVDADGTCNHGD